MNIRQEDEVQILAGSEQIDNKQQAGEVRMYKIGLIIATIVFCMSVGANLWTLGAYKNNNYGVKEEKEIQKQNVLKDIDYETINVIPDHKNTQIQAKRDTEAQIKANNLSSIPVNATKRISFGASAQIPYKMRMAIIQKPNSKTTNCLLTNGIDVITQKTIKTANSVLSLASYWKWVVILADYDPIADKLLEQMMQKSKVNGLNYKFTEKNVSVDSEYKFITVAVQKCQTITYIQHHFSISLDQSRKIQNILTQKNPQNAILYSEIATFNQKSIKLKSLMSIDLQWLTSSEINQYLFIFNANFLSIITPLSYAYYAKYTIEQIFIRPILALVQGTQALKGIKETVHGIGGQYGSGKYFALEQVKTAKNRTVNGKINRGPPKEQTCFISYPENPYNASFEDLKAYFTSLSNIKGIQTTTIVINLPQKFNHPSILHSTFILLQNYSHLNVRLRIHANKSVSSLSVYESAYTYCHKSAIMVASRHNIRWASNFLTQLQSKIEYKYHYYFAEFQVPTSDGKNEVVTIDKNDRFEDKSSRYSAHHYEGIFKHVQIFKSDLLKSMYFHILKCDEVDFYQTEASFVVPMQEMVRMILGVIPGPLFSVNHHQKITQTEKNQMVNLQHYFRWNQLPSNNLYPIAYSSLENVAFKKYAREKMPKLIHQVWLGNGTISPFMQKLHTTIKQVNSDFTVKLWKDEDLTKQNFPLTYPLIHRALQYQKIANRSYTAPVVSLIRYQLLYRLGGIYIDFKTEGRKPLNPFLKYELFFIDIDYDPEHYIYPANVGNGIMGAMVGNYHMLLTLTELISQDTFNFKAYNFPKIVGGFVLRHSLTDLELFTQVGFGFQLFSQKPGTGRPNQCTNDTVPPQADQQRFRVTDSMTGKIYNIFIPCIVYPQAYLIMYKVLAGSWKPKKIPSTPENPTHA